MIDFIKGIVIEKNPVSVIVENNGLGYQVNVSVNTFKKLPSVGENVNLKTYLHVREDNLQLFGFYADNERMVFTSLISISGVGPRLAQTILSGLKLDELICAIREGDVGRLTSISGVGKKTAQRLVIELKEKFTHLGLITRDELKEHPFKLTDPVEEEAMMALLALGYKKPVVEKAIIRVRSNGKILTVEDLIKQVLQNI